MNLKNTRLSEIKPATKGHILYDSIYMKYLAKSIETECRLMAAEKKEKWEATA